MVTIVPSIIHVLVTAHPDDESMFFLPWIYYTTRQRTFDPSVSSAVWLLCLTTGNYDGLGKIRSQELHDLNKNVLQDNGFQKVIILDEPDIMPDHPNQRWNTLMVAQQIHATLRSTLDEEYGPNQNRPITMNFVTFDQNGVSGHVNHIDTYYAVQHLFSHQLQQLHHSSSSTISNQSSSILLANKVLDVYVLATIKNPITKYLPIVEWIRLLLHCVFGWFPDSDMSDMPSNQHQHSTQSTYRLLQPSLNWFAMSTHQSQFVWYRRLFVVFSIYTYKNTFRKITSTTQTNDGNDVHSNDHKGSLRSTIPLSSSEPTPPEETKKEL